MWSDKVTPRGVRGAAYARSASVGAAVLLALGLVGCGASDAFVDTAVSAVPNAASAACAASVSSASRAVASLYDAGGGEAVAASISAALSAAEATRQQIEPQDSAWGQRLGDAIEAVERSSLAAAAEGGRETYKEELLASLAALAEACGPENKPAAP